MNQTTPPPSDDDLPDERELAALYARLPKAEPDASLDAAVLAEAARAMPVSRRPRWPVALASAAVLVLSVGVAWQVRELQPVPSAMPTAAAPAPSTPAPATPAVAAAAAPDAAGTRAADSIAAEAAPTRELRKSASASNVGAASAAMPAQRAQALRSASPAIAAQLAPAPAPAPAPPAPAIVQQVTPPPAPAAPEAAIVSAAPQHYESSQPAPSGVLRETMAAKVAADESDVSKAPSAPVATGRVAVPNALGPDDRVGEIRRLLGIADRAQALRELKDLRRRYPHYDLPQDLRDLSP
jgi:Meckel syndrome type 1 protein